MYLNPHTPREPDQWLGNRDGLPEIFKSQYCLKEQVTTMMSAVDCVWHHGYCSFNSEILR